MPDAVRTVAFAGASPATLQPNAMCCCVTAVTRSVMQQPTCMTGSSMLLLGTGKTSPAPTPLLVSVRAQQALSLLCNL
jgi:hypothetical protein